jgi:glycosyltransferase involved in cell wall biosynthesis
MLPLVSIIIPVYNAEKYIAAAISSALDQTWENKEIIVVDDGSTDKSLSIARGFESDIVKVFSQTNRGASAARNKGVSKANGDFVQFLDADDLLMPDKIESQLSGLKESRDKLSICLNIYFEDDSELKSLRPNSYDLDFYKANKDPFEFLMRLYGAENNKGGMITVHAWLTPLELIKKAGDWNEILTTNDDGEFFCRVVLASGGIIFQPDTYCYYRKFTKGNSLSAQKNLSAYHSQFLSLQLIEQHLWRYKPDVRINNAIKRLLIELLIVVYPGHPKIAASIEKRVIELGGIYHFPVIGGPVIELIKKWFGWKLARHLQYYNPFR